MPHIPKKYSDCLLVGLRFPQWETLLTLITSRWQRILCLLPVASSLKQRFYNVNFYQISGAIKKTMLIRGDYSLNSTGAQKGLGGWGWSMEEGRHNKKQTSADTDYCFLNCISRDGERRRATQTE